MLPTFDHRLMSHDIKFSILAHIVNAHYFLEQSKSPLLNFFKKLPIIQSRIFGPGLSTFTLLFPSHQIFSLDDTLIIFYASQYAVDTYIN